MDFDRKPGEDTTELEAIKNLIRDLPDNPDEGEFTLESIMAEERFAAVTTPRRKRRPEPEAPKEDTDPFAKIAEEMRALSRSEGTKPSAAVLTPEKDVPPKPGAAPDIDMRQMPATHQPPPKAEPVIDERFTDIFSKISSASKREETGDDLDFDLNDGFGEEKSGASAPGLLQILKNHIRKPLPPLETLPNQAYKRVAPYIGSLRLRTILAFLLALPMLYTALGPMLPVPLPDFLRYSRDPYHYLLITTVILILIMLCAVDVVARGLSDLFHMRPGAETLVTLSGIATLVHAVKLMIDLPEFQYMPFTTVAGISFFFTLWAGFYQYNGYRHTYKTAMEAEEGHARLITLEEDLWDGLSGYTKREGSLEGFVSRTETPDVSRRFFSLFAPILMVAALVFATSASIGSGRPELFFWAWSAVSLATAPPCALFVFALPFSRVARRLSVKGGAIAGWTAARELKGGDFLAARDEDFFPPEMISLNGLKIFNNHSYGQVTLYASALLEASGNSLRYALREITRDKEDQRPEATHVEHHEAGGLSGELGRDRVLLGSSDFMLRSGIRLPRELIIKKAVYITINLELAGIFAVNYIPSSSTAGAVMKLNRNGVTPMMAVRDFNITPLLLKDKYKLDPEMLEYPTIEDRLALSDETRDTLERPSAFVTRDGISPMTECVIGARRLRKVALTNLWITIICTLVSVLGMFYFTLSGTAESALAIVPGNVTLYFLLWWLPVWLCSSAAHRY